MAAKRKEKGNEDEIALAPSAAPEQAKKKRAAKAKRAANDDDDEADELDDEYAELEAEEDAADFAPRSVGAWHYV